MRGIVAFIAVLATSAFGLAGDGPSSATPDPLTLRDVLDARQRPEVRVLRARYLNDAQDQSWSRFTLLEAALVAVDCWSASERREWLRAYEAHGAAVLKRIRANPDASNRRRIALEALHQHVLTGKYRPDCSDPRETLRTGDFNCVSATLLYLQICRDAGLAPSAGCTPTHVVALFRGEPGIRVQTTSPRGFEPGLDPTAREEVRSISDVQLVGKLHYNRGVVQLSERRYSAAIASFLWSLKLDAADASAKHNLLTALNNAALDAAGDQHFDAARKLLKLAASLDPDHEALLENEQHVDYRWIEFLCGERRFEEALLVARRGVERRPETTLYRRAVAVVYQRWATRALQDGNVSVSRELLANARAETPGAWYERIEQYVTAQARPEVRAALVGYRGDP